ncbi:MAG: 50S ribosomal protein L22 [Candidatus Woesearchaeota archaeon]
MAYNYAFEGFNPEIMARASRVNSRISLKKSVELSRAIRGMKVSRAKQYLIAVTKQEELVPYRRFNTEMPHKRGKGVMAGGYPVNVAKEFLIILHNALKNAENLGLGEVDELRIKSASVRQGASRYKMSRLSGRKMKATHIEIILVQDTKKKQTHKSSSSKKGGDNK